MNNLLEAHNLVKHYGNRVVVKDIDLIVAPGEVVGLIGPNGAGKSTTLEMVLGSMDTPCASGYRPEQDVSQHQRACG